MIDEMTGRLAAEGGVATLSEVARARASLAAERPRRPPAVSGRDSATTFDLAEPELEILLLAAGARTRSSLRPGLRVPQRRHDPFVI